MVLDSNLLSNEAREFCGKLAALFRKQNKTILFGGNQPVSLSVPGYQQVVQAVNLLHTQHSVLDRKLLIDLEYLESVLQRLNCLTLYSRDVRLSTAWIPLAGLKSLTSVELKGVPLHLVHGLESLRDQIYSIKIVSCKLEVEDLIAGCLADSTSPREWRRLATVALCHNSLSRLDSCLGLAPRIHTLAASHNHLTITQGLESLESLHTLVLSYNHLKKLPSLSTECTLTTLTIGYNRLETLDGLERLSCLESLDISGNCLMHHDVLAPVSALSHLKQLDTRYNPLSSHYNHRRIASSWLHNDLVHADFTLDSILLSKAEYLQIGSSRMLTRGREIDPDFREETSELDESINNPPEMQISFDLESASLAGRSREGSLVSGVTVTTQGGRKRRSKKKRVRVAIISDQPSDSELTDDNYKSIQVETHPESQQVSETARQMSILRTKYGEENWLREKSGETLNQILGLESDNGQKIESKRTGSTLTSPTKTSTPVNKSEVEIVLGGKVAEVSEAQHAATDSNSDKEKESSIEAISQDERVGGSQSSDTSERHPTKSGDDIADANTNAADADSFYSMYKAKETSPAGKVNECQISVERSLPGDDSGYTEKLTLSIDKEFIREQRDGEGTRVKWFLHSLEGLDVLKCEDGKVVVHLLFSTVKRGRRERMYTMTEQNYSRLVAVTAGQLEQMAQSYQGLTYLQCIKCQKKFTQDISHQTNKKKSLEVCCVVCGSNMVIECRGPAPGAELHADIALPAVEALDIESSLLLTVPSSDTKEGNSVPEASVLNMVEENNSSIKKISSGTVLNVQADIHDHEIKDHSLPDLVPTQAQLNRKGSSASTRSRNKLGQTHRSDSSSDISVISDNSIDVIQHSEKSSQGSERQRSSSPSSIEILQHNEPSNEDTVTADHSNDSSFIACNQDTTDTEMVKSGMQSSGSTMMQESSSSGSMANSVIQAQPTNTLTSPNKKKDRNDDSIYLSCQENSLSTDEETTVTLKATATTLQDTTTQAFASCRDDTNTIYEQAEDNLTDLESKLHSKEGTPVNQEESSVRGSPLSSPDGTTSPPPSKFRGFFSSFSSTPKTSPRKRSGSLTNSPMRKSSFKKSTTDIKRSVSDLNQASSQRFFSAQNSANSSISGEVKSSPQKIEKPFRQDATIMKWDYEDFANIDHRIRLYCEINLFHQQDEELLLVTKGNMIVKSLEKTLKGLLVLSNKNIYLLKATREESEEPDDWLCVSCSASLSRLHRIIQLLGAQGLALELTPGDVKPSSGTYLAAGPYLSRVGGTFGTPSDDCYYLLLADANRTKVMIDQTVDILQQRVRTNPIPVVTELDQEEKKVLAKQIDEYDVGEDQCVEAVDHIAQDGDVNTSEQTQISSFHLAFDAKGDTVSVVLTQDDTLVITDNLFPWLLLSQSQNLNIHHKIRVSTIVAIDIYQSMLESISILLSDDSVLHLTFQSEAGLQDFVRSLRTAWQRSTSRTLEDITSFHPVGCKTVLKMSDLMEESVSFKDFDFSQWIKVTSSDSS